MKKIKNMMKKGGVADVVTIMVIVGLVIALIVAVVLPIINRASDTGGEAADNAVEVNTFITELGSDNNPEVTDWISRGE